MARGIQTAVDSADFFVQHTAGQDTRDAALLANFVATAAGGVVGADQINTVHKGLMLMLAVASISVNTATLAVEVDAKRGDGTYFPIARVSLDGITNGNANAQGVWTIYPGASNAPANPAVNAANPVSGVNILSGLPLPGKMRVTATLTITTTASMSGIISYSVGQSKIL